jgi:hypothetical protein
MVTAPTAENDKNASIVPPFKGDNSVGTNGAPCVALCSCDFATSYSLRVSQLATFLVLGSTSDLFDFGLIIPHVHHLFPVGLLGAYIHFFYLPITSYNTFLF